MRPILFHSTKSFTEGQALLCAMEHYSQWHCIVERTDPLQTLCWVNSEIHPFYSKGRLQKTCMCVCKFQKLTTRCPMLGKSSEWPDDGESPMWEVMGRGKKRIYLIKAASAKQPTAFRGLGHAPCHTGSRILRKVILLPDQVHKQV